MIKENADKKAKREAAEEIVELNRKIYDILAFTGISPKGSGGWKEEAIKSQIDGVRELILETRNKAYWEAKNNILLQWVEEQSNG